MVHGGCVLTESAARIRPARTAGSAGKTFFRILKAVVIASRAT
jgi:hypothetical protein